MKAYKVFDSNLQCRGFQYEVGKTYTQKEKPVLCIKGFHACKEAVDCFNYYSFDPKNRVCEVELLGDVVGEDTDKQATNKIKITKELNWNEVLSLVNMGSGNTGNRNSGNWNSGNRNSGSRNSGDWNSGDWNSGYRNSGNWNSGYRNSGDWNSGDWNSGYFNSTTPEYINVFNKRCLREKWDSCRKPSFIHNVILNQWICFSDMTEEEKTKHKNAYVCDGYLKTYSYKGAWGNAFKKTSKEDVELLKALPNFNAKVFEEITGIKI